MNLIENIQRIKQVMRLLKEDFDWDFANRIVTQEKPQEIYELLLKMFPMQKEVIDYHYNDEMGQPFAEWRRKIHDIDEWVLEGPIIVEPTKINLDQESFIERKRKYQDFISGKIDKYFRDNAGDPRNLDFDKLPPVTLEKEGNYFEVDDGKHRVFLAKMNNKPLKSYIWVRKHNDSPYVNDIKALFKR